MSDPSFAAAYARWSDDALLDVLDNPHEYLPHAVEAAQQELHSRSLTPEQYEDARARQQARRIRVAQDLVHSSRHKTRALTWLVSLREFLNPLTLLKRDASDYILLVSVVLGLFAAYQLYSHWEIVVLSIQYSDIETAITYSLQFIIYASMALLLWYRTRFGWMLTIAYALFSLYLLHLHALIGLSYAFDDDSYSSDVFTLSIESYVVTLALWGSLMVVLWIPRVRESYLVDRRMIMFAILMATAFAFYMTWMLSDLFNSHANSIHRSVLQ